MTAFLLLPRTEAVAQAVNCDVIFDECRRQARQERDAYLEFCFEAFEDDLESYIGCNTMAEDAYDQDLLTCDYNYRDCMLRQIRHPIHSTTTEMVCVTAGAISCVRTAAAWVCTSASETVVPAVLQFPTTVYETAQSAAAAAAALWCSIWGPD